MYISYDYYRVFFYVARYQSFTQAANALLSNQPNVTRTIKKLENELGCTLFVRSNRGVRLTPEGERLYAHVRVAVEQLQEGEAELGRERSLQSGAVSIATSEVALRCFLLPVLKQYREHYPGVRLRISHSTTLRALGALKSGASDVAVVTTPLGNAKGLRVRVVKEVQEVAIRAVSLPGDWERPIPLSDLADIPIISLGAQSMTHTLYSEWFLRYGLDFTPEIEAATADQILPLVKNGLGVGFVPQEFLEGEDREAVCPVRLAEPIPSRSICLVKQAGQTLSIAAKALERMILDFCTFQMGRT